MHQFKVPDAAAGGALEAHEALSKEVVAETVTAVPVVGRCGGREIGVTKILISADHRPDISLAVVLPRLVLPGLVAELARLWNDAELLSEPARSDIEPPDVSRCFGQGRRPIQRVHPHDDRLATDQRGAVLAVHVEARHALPKVDLAALAEVADRLAAFRIEEPLDGFR